jgi:signal transduction histidine kinase
VLVSVQDSGIGLDEQSLELVFEAFYTIVVILTRFLKQDWLPLGF